MQPEIQHRKYHGLWMDFHYPAMEGIVLYYDHFLIILWKSNSRHPIQRKLITHFRQRAGKTTEADVQGAEKVKINLRRNLSLQYPDLICGGGKILCI